MQNQITIKRIQKEQKEILNLKLDYLCFNLVENNNLEYHFTLKGEENTIYENGYYHGCLFLPHNYPFSAPDVIFYTPNGRFETNKKICLSQTSYHNNEWNSSLSSNLISKIYDWFFKIFYDRKWVRNWINERIRRKN